MSARASSLLRHIIRVAGWPLETRDPRATADAIVVLGAPLRADGHLSLAGRERVEEAARRFAEGVAPLVLFTGGAAHSAAEAPAMALRGQELGIPKACILIEDASRTTAENARFSAEILRSRGVKSVWVISQPFHLRRGRRLFRIQGFLASSQSLPESAQYQSPGLAWRWIAREYLAWLAHFLLPNH